MRDVSILASLRQRDPTRKPSGKYCSLFDFFTDMPSIDGTTEKPVRAATLSSGDGADQASVRDL
jgi:hypothetical protein